MSDAKYYFNKFQVVRKIFSRKIEDIPLATKQSLLDVGCRGCELKAFIDNKNIQYFGLDLIQNSKNSVDYVLNISTGFPFNDGQFDYVVALDLLEHVDDFQNCLNEMLRISKKTIILALPNQAHLFYRLRYLFCGIISDKYKFSFGVGKDRHRWITTKVQSDMVMNEFALKNKLILKSFSLVGSTKKAMFASLCRILNISPNLWEWATIYVLDRESLDS
jgi:SAM-dependent methyltransferase